MGSHPLGCLDCTPERAEGSKRRRRTQEAAHVVGNRLLGIDETILRAYHRQLRQVLPTVTRCADTDAGLAVTTCPLAPALRGCQNAPEDEPFDPAQPDWWQPQPHATLDTDEYQDRPTAPLAAALSCTLCRGLLREAMTAPECGHTYCYDCIETRVEVGGKHNVCPVPGCGLVLGANPFDHHRIMYDSLLDTLVQKIFPRPQLDAALTARRAEREEATRQARAAVNGTTGRNATAAAAHQRLASPRPGRSGSRGLGGRGGSRQGEADEEVDDDDSGQEGDAEGSDEDRRGRPHEATRGKRGPARHQ